MKLGRNEPCHCGSGQKYKKCHLPKDEASESAQFAAEAAERKATAEREAKEAEEKEASDAPAQAGATAAGHKPAPTKKLDKGAKGASAAPLFRRRAV